MKYHVLVVEDEVALLRGLVRGLSSVPSLHINGKATVEEALEVISNDPPDLLITDLNLAGRSGIELLDALNQRSLRIAVIVMTAYHTAFSSQLSKHPSIKVLEKPVGLQELRRVIEDTLARHTTPTSIGPFQLADFLQMAGLGRHTLQINVELQDQTRGWIEIVDGFIWNVFCGSLEGFPALERLMYSPLQRLGHSTLPTAPHHRQIHQHWEEILLDMARIKDELDRDRSPAPSENDSLEFAEWHSRELPILSAAESPPPSFACQPPQAPFDSPHASPIPHVSSLEAVPACDVENLLFCLVEALTENDKPRASSLFQQALTLYPDEERLRFRWLQTLVLASSSPKV